MASVFGGGRERGNGRDGSAVETMVTADQMDRVLRRRLHTHNRAWVKILGSEIPPGMQRKDAMLELLREKLRARGDRGIANLVKNLVFEPGNPFQPDKRRRLKREVVAMGSLLAVLLGALVCFNFLER